MYIIACLLTARTYINHAAGILVKLKIKKGGGGSSEVVYGQESRYFFKRCFFKWDFVSFLEIMYILVG